jgi:hypothetical protein
MNKELLAFLEAQLNSGVDNDTAMRAAINKGYDYLEVSGAISSLGQKKKVPTGPSSSSELYRQATSEFESKQAKQASSSASISVPNYAQQGLGYVYSGTPVQEIDVPQEKKEKLATTQEAFIGESDERFAKQVQDTYKYLGYTEVKAKELTASLYNEASSQGVAPQDLWRNTYHVGYKKEDLDALGGVVPVESREKYQDIVSLGDAAWGNMIDSARKNGATNKDIYENTGLRPMKGILTDDVTYDDSLFVFDADDDTDPAQGLKRFWNSAVLRTKISNAMSRDDMDATAIAHYQSELQKNSDDKDYLKSLGTAGVLLEDYVLDAVVSPVLESVMSLGMGAITSPLASIEDLAQGGRDIQDIANVGSALATPLSALKGAVGIAGLVARGGFTAQQSYALSASSKVLEVMNELGVNTSSAIELDKAFQDKEIMDAAKKRAQDYGIPVAILDGITAGVAGKLATSLVKRGYTKVAAETLETVAEGALGATGEALGQISEKGKVYSWGDVALEAIGELAIGVPGRAIEAVKRNAKGENERAYIDYVARAAATNEDASVTTNTAYMMNYGEAMAIDNKIREVRDALKSNGLSRETRASLRGELSTLTESKFEILNKNIEQVRNLAPESRSQAQQLTSEILSIKSDLKLTERKSPAQKGLIAQLTNKVQQLQTVLGGGTVQGQARPTEFVAPTAAPAASFEVKVPEATTPIIETPAAPTTITEAVGTRVTYETPSGQTIEGFLFDEGAGKLVVEDDNGAIYELGNAEDVGEAQLQEYKLGAIQENVQKGEDGISYIINGKRYEYRTDNPASLINRDNEGKAVSVTLFDAASGKSRTFRGALGNTLAYDISRPGAQPQVQAATIAPTVEPTPISEPTPSVAPAPIAEPAVEVPMAEPAVEAAQPAQDFSAQRVTAQAGRVRAGRGVTARVASSVNKLATAFKNTLDAPITVVFHDSLASIEDATGGPNEAYYDGENTIHLLKSASDQAIKEEFAHAGLRKAIAGNQQFREAMLASLELLAEQTNNSVLKQFINDRLEGYKAQQRSLGATDAQALAVAQEEAVIGVLADFTNNLNQLDASIVGKIRRAINEVLYRFGLREFAIGNNESFIGLAEKFALASRTGRTLNVDVKNRDFQEIKARSRKSLSKASGTTQVATTTGSYRKVAESFKGKVNENSRVLDYGAGLGLGTDAMSDVLVTRVQSLEINPERWQGAAPVDYTSSGQIQTKFDNIVSLNVVNVVPREIRDFIVQDIYQKLVPGGTAYISSRKFKGDIDGAKNFELGPEDKSYIIKRREGGEIIDVYQKGYDGNELVDYVKSILPEAKVSKGGNWGASTVIIERPIGNINQVVPESKVTPEMKNGRARLIDYLDVRGIVPTSINNLGSGSFGNAYLVESAAGKTVLKQTYSLNESLIGKYYVDQFNGDLPGIAKFNDVTAFYVAPKTASKDWFDENSKRETLVYIDKQFIQTSFNTKRKGKVSGLDFYTDFETLLGGGNRYNMDFSLSRGFRIEENGVVKYFRPFSPMGSSVIANSINRINFSMNELASQDNIKSVSKLLERLSGKWYDDFFAVAEELNAISYDNATESFSIDVDFVLEFLGGINNILVSTQETLGFVGPLDIHPGNIGFSGEGKYGISPVLFDLDSNTKSTPPDAWEAYRNGEVVNYEPSRSIVRTIFKVGRQKTIEYVKKMTENLDYFGTMDILEAFSMSPLGQSASPGDWAFYAQKMGSDTSTAQIVYGEIRKIATRKYDELQGRSRLTPEAVAALKERVVPGRRIGQGVITSKVSDQTPGVDGTLTLSMEMARQYPSVYIKNAWFLTQHPMMRGMADDSLVEKKGKKAGMDAVVSEENMLKADAIYNNFIEVAKGNLLFLHDQFDDTVREYAKRWYDGANAIAQDIASKHNVTLEQASGIIAALSPQKDWFMNIDLAYRVVDTIQKSVDTPFDGDMYEHSLSVKRGDKKAYDKLSKEAKAKKDKAIATHKSIIDGMKGKTFAQLDNDLERAIFIRHYDEKFNPRHYNEYNPVGEVVGRAKTAKGVDAKVAWSSYGIIASAVASARNSSAQSISDALGTQHKIRNFYNNIANPDATFGDVTMDTHAVGAAELLIVSGNSVEVAHNLGSSASNVNGIAGMYYAFAEAYKLAAAERNILPREMQSITWEAIRLLYKDTFKNAKNRATNESIWNKYNNNEITIDETRQQLLDLGGGIDRPGWYRFVGEVGSGQVEPGVQSGERTDANVPARRRARTAKPGDDFPAPGRPAGRSRKLRGSAKRFVSLVSEESLIDEILSNPDNYYTPQVLDQVRAQLQMMGKGELVEQMSDGALSGIADAGFSGLKDGDIRVMAAIEMLNRLYDSGDTPGYIKQLDRLFQYGTGIAQALRQFAELKSSTPAGLENMIMKMYERQNIELTEEARQTLAELAAELFDAQRQYRDVSDIVINEGTLDANIDEDSIKAAEDRLFEATRAMDKFNATFAQNWGDILSQIMQGNLLTMKSQVINLYANVINVGKYATRLLVAAPFDRVISKAKGEEVTVRPSFAAFAHAVGRGAKGFYEAGQIARYGVQPGNAEYRMSLGLKPIQSLMIAFASKEKQSVAFESQRDEWNYRMKMLVRGTFGLPAEVMFRLLPFGDRPIYQFVEGFELYQYGRSLGLEGDSLRDFLKFPNLEAREIAQKRALEVTFQDDSKLARGAQAFVRQLETGFGSTNNAMLKVFIRANLPFVKTPANILNQTIRLSNPVLPLYRIVSLVAKKGSSKEISEAIGELFISSVIFMTAKKLWENGLISASADQSDSRERGLSYSVFPAASINITGLDRWLNGGDATFQEGDEFYNYQKMGLGGAIMGAQVAGLKMIDKTNLKQEEILEIGETAPDQDSKDPMDVVAEFSSTSLGTLSNVFDQSFLTGVDGLLEVLRNPEPATFSSYVEGIFRAAVSIPLPNQLSVAFRAEREYLPDYRSNNITEKLVNVVNDRMFGTLGDVPIRVNEWGEDIKQTPEGANPLYYNWFDPTNGRIGTTDPVKVEIYNLFIQTEDPGVIPGVPVEIQSRKLTVPGSDIRVEINTDEANKLMRQLGTQRMEVLNSLITSEDWKTYDTETRVMLLKNVYNNIGDGKISIDGERFNFDWYNHKLDIIQARLFSEQ